MAKTWIIPWQILWRWVTGSVVRKIAFILLFTSLTAVAIGWLGMMKIRQMKQVATDIFISNTSVLYPLSDYLTSIYTTEKDAYDAVNGNSRALSNLSRDVYNVSGQFGVFSGYLSSKVNAEMKPMVDRYNRALNDLYNELQKGGPGAASSYAAFRNESIKLYQYAYELSQNLRRGGMDTFSRGGKIYDSALKLQQGLTVFSVALAILISLFVALSIIRPLQNLRASAGRLALGDLRVRVDVRSHDEVGAVGTAFNEAMEELRSMVTQAMKYAQEINTSSSELFRVTDSTSAALKELNQLMSKLTSDAMTQSQTVDETIRTLQKASEEAITVADNTLAINNNCQELSRLAERGKVATEQMVAIIEAMVNTVAEIDTTVRNLAGDSQQIRLLADVIRNIADKTTLLSLNAAIEAARAGEQGRGFAVVAHQIRQLAENARKSVEQINEEIAGVLNHTENVVNVVKRGRLEIDRSRTNLDETANLFKDLVRQAETITQKIAQIAAIASEVNRSHTQVITEMNKVTEISQDNLAAAEQVSASFQEQYANTLVVTDAARQLRDLAGQMATAAGRFQV